MLRRLWGAVRTVARVVVVSAVVSVLATVLLQRLGVPAVVATILM